MTCLVNFVDSEAALGVEKESEVFLGLLDRDDVHETSRVRHVRSGLKSMDGDKSDTFPSTLISFCMTIILTSL